MLPVMAAEEVAGGTCGDNSTWLLDDTGTITISGTGAMAGCDYEAEMRDVFDESEAHLWRPCGNM